MGNQRPTMAAISSELKVPDRGFEWGYKAGPAQIAFAMKLNDTGDWVETGVTVGNTAAQRFFDMTVRKQK
jgi:hypothetical protein